MSDMELSAHAKAMLVERNIPEEWLWRTISAPDSTEEVLDDRNTHFIKAIEENESRVLRVVVNANVVPHRVVTVFFDRRLRRKR